jgi:hypothetical protein
VSELRCYVVFCVLCLFGVLFLGAEVYHSVALVLRHTESREAIGRAAWVLCGVSLSFFGMVR